MEIQGTNGFKTHLYPNKPFTMGRKNGPNPKDQSISRAHISLSLATPTTVTFHVIGKNPVWVSTKDENDGKVKVFNGSEMGELNDGDMFCVSFQHPVWFSVRKLGGKSERQSGDFGEGDLSQSLECGVDCDGDGDGEFELGSFDISHFDPVRDFGFLVIGHEFDQYEKQINRDLKKWNWFLEDTRGESDEDEVPKKRGGRRKRKKARDDDVDEEWTEESEDEAEVTTKARKVHAPKYHTRSKDPTKKDGKFTKKTSSKVNEEEEDDDEDEGDETLGGFIVDDAVEEDDDNDDEDEMDEEEEEFVEDELDD